MTPSHEHLNSGNVEFYTPQPIIEAARQTMGGIDLDPASCAVANARVRAAAYYSLEQGYDGLVLPWFGRVFQNHPFGAPEKACGPNCKKKTCVDRGHHISEDTPGNADWINRLDRAYRSGEIEQACGITWASMSEAWFRPLLRYPHCIPYGRVHYYRPDGTQAKQANKGSVITYLGPNLGAFMEAFASIGAVYVPALHIDTGNSTR